MRHGYDLRALHPPPQGAVSAAAAALWQLRAVQKAERAHGGDGTYVAVLGPQALVVEKVRPALLSLRTPLASRSHHALPAHLQL